MNRSILIYIIGVVLKIEAFLLLLPVIVSVIYREPEGKSYLLVAIVALVLGFIISFKKPADTTFYLKEGCVATALSWFVLSFVGGVPFYLSGDIPSFLDAMFESVSGFTTTGSSILIDIEALSNASLFWRSFAHWIGGLGVLVFLMAIIPMAGGSNINLLKTESTGPSVGKLTPKMRSNARILYAIYIIMTAADVLLLVIGKVSLFDALCTAFGTTGTGGFSIHNDSMVGYTLFAKWVTIVFMILASINFSVYYLLALKKIKKILAFDELRIYLGILFTSAVIIIFDLMHSGQADENAITDAAFQTVSIMSSTGFSTLNFDNWPTISRTILMIVAFIGCCAGSTGGGFKVTRIIILLKSLKREIQSYLHPKSVKIIKMNKEVLDEDIVKSTGTYFMAYVFILIVSVLIVSFEEYDLVTNTTAVIATLNNVGPGLSMVNASSNFAFFNPLSKLVLMFDMIAGRLELFPLIIFFYPSTLKELFGKNKTKKEI